MNNKGFVQIKVLTILFILGIICFTLIPYLYDLHTNNKKEEYIEVAKKYIDEVKDSINSLEYEQIPSTNEGLLVKLKDLNENSSSPYGKFEDEYSYVVVLNMGEYYDYYFAAIDSSNRGIPVVNEKELSVDSIVYGKSQLTSIDKSSSIDNLYIAGTIFKQSENSKKSDNNILLTPVSGELTVSYDFIENAHKIYNNLIKNIDTDIFNKEATINNGVLKYNNEVINNSYSKDINGFFRYISFPNNDKKLYYSSFVSYSKSYVAGLINESSDYTTSDIVFDSRPAIVINKDAITVTDNEQKYLMWNLMTIYPDNSNYAITECGALIVKNNNEEITNIDFNTEGVMIGKSNNGCELGNIFAIRKNNVKENEKLTARGYVKYKDKNGNERTTLGRDTISGIVK